MNVVSSKNARIILTAISLFFLTACAVKLAPEYDKAIAGGLVSVNQKMMQFFAATASGSEAAVYEKREAQYNEIIGGLDALIIQAEARSVPPDSIARRLVDQILSRRTNNNVSSGDCKDKAPTICALKRMTQEISTMRSFDKKQGLTSAEAALHKKQIVLDMDIALTYESLLER